MKTIPFLMAALGAAVLLSSPVPVPAQPAATSPPVLPASVRLALPAEVHRWMDPLVGQWNVEMNVFTGPGQPAITSKELTARRELILGGRYLREELQGLFAGNPASRVATLSFNNLDERWELSTIDTFEPGQMWYLGRVQGSPRRFELHGESTEAGSGPTPTGRKRQLRFEFEITDNNRNVQRIYVKYPAQPEQLFVEQIFTRRQ